MFGLVAAERSLRGVEELTARLPRRVRRASGIKRRISDTKLRDTLLQLDAAQTRAALHRQVKAEHRRGQLRANGLPIKLVAVDGKGLAKLADWSHPDVQRVQQSGGLPYGLARVHRAFLVASNAVVCIDQRPIPGDTNEIGAMPDVVHELHEAYGRTTIFDTLITDAGNSSQAVASELHELGYGYILAIKENHGEIHLEALRGLTQAVPRQEITEQERGQRITYRLYRYRLDHGYLGWKHARQLVRVERLVESDDKSSEGNRYFVSNLTWNRLSDRQWLKAVRADWRCENNGNWTADVVWEEDARRTPWTTDAEAIYALGSLRMLALNILAVMRSMVRQPTYPLGKLPWQLTARRMLLELTSHSETETDASFACV